jgi:hypothetical protein
MISESATIMEETVRRSTANCLKIAMPLKSKAAKDAAGGGHFTQTLIMIALVEYAGCHDFRPIRALRGNKSLAASKVLHAARTLRGVRSSVRIRKG